MAVLGESVEQLEPPPELRERVLAVVRADVAAGEPSVRDRADAPRRERRGLRACSRGPRSRVGLARRDRRGVGGYLIARTRRRRRRDDGAGAPAQPGIGGTLAVGENSSMLDLHGLGRLKGGEVYQVWVAEGTEPAALLQLHPGRRAAGR